MFWLKPIEFIFTKNGLKPVPIDCIMSFLADFADSADLFHIMICEICAKEFNKFLSYLPE